MRFPRFRLTVLRLMIGIAVAAVLLSVGLWSSEMWRRWKHNRSAVARYQFNAKYHEEIEKINRKLILELEQVFKSWPRGLEEFKENEGRRINYRTKVAAWHSAMARKYRRAATHPFDPILPTIPSIPSESDIGEPDPYPLVARSDDVIDPSDRGVETLNQLGADQYGMITKGSVTQLNLWNQKITDADLAHFRGLKGLKELDLSGTSITDAGLIHLKGMVNLEKLELNGTKITNAGLHQLKSLARLESLGIRETKIDDEGLVYLKRSSRTFGS